MVEVVLSILYDVLVANVLTGRWVRIFQTFQTIVYVVVVFVLEHEESDHFYFSVVKLDGQSVFNFMPETSAGES